MGISHLRSRVHNRGQSDCRPYSTSGYVHGGRRFFTILNYIHKVNLPA